MMQHIRHHFTEVRSLDGQSVPWAPQWLRSEAVSAGRASHTGREGDRQASQWLDLESDSHVAVGRPAGN